MRKKTLSWMLVIAMMLSLMPFSAMTAYAAAEGDWTYTLYDGDTTAAITGYAGTDTEIVIPATIAGKPVTRIGSNAFLDNTLITSVTIPDSILRIESGAFQNSMVSTIDLGNGLTYIGQNAFNGSKIVNVTIPYSVTQIDNNAFANNRNLTSVTINGNNLLSLGDGAFSITSLSTIRIPTSLSTIPSWAFSDTSLNSLTIPANITSIGYFAFGNNPYLSSVLFEGNAPDMANYVFSIPSSSFTVYYYSGATGFTTPTWTAGDAILNTVELDAPSTDVCQIGSTGYENLSDALAAAVNGETIILLQEINHTADNVSIYKDITFDLNGYDLIINSINTANPALSVGPGGIVDFIDSSIGSDGEFNVNGAYMAIYCHDGGSVKASNASASQGDGIGVFSSNGNVVIVGGVTGRVQGVLASGLSGMVLINGDVVASNASGIGVEASYGANVTVDGTITATNYVKIEDQVLSKEDALEITTKVGYLTYSDGTSTVWVAKELPYASNVSITGSAIVGESLTGEYDFNGTSESGTTYKWLAESSIESQIFSTMNIAGVNNDPTVPAEFVLSETTLISRIENYHWNYGSGALPGTIALQEADGTLYGPWDAVGVASNLYWLIQPYVELPAGTYTVIDSSNETWANNPESGYRGMTAVYTKNYSNDFTPIDDATEQSYLLTSDDIGKMIKFEVTVSDSGGAIGIPVRSSSVGPVSPLIHVEPFSGGTGTELDPYNIETKNDLLELEQKVNNGAAFYNIYFQQTADIYLTQDWTPIGLTSDMPFSGTYDGNGNSVFNMQIGSVQNPQNSYGYLGLFGYINGTAKISNLSIVDIKIYSSSSTATGGLVGQNDGGVIDHCGTSGDIFAYSRLGGLVGDNKGQIFNSYSTVNLSSSGSSSGGLVGQNDGGNIRNCYATGNVEGGAYPHAGGLVGYTVGWNGTNYIENCYATGNVSGSAWGYIGGIFGRDYEGRTSLTNNYWNEDAEIIATELGGFTPEVHGSADGYLSKSASFMKSDDFVSLLNSELPNQTDYYSWKIVAGQNDGYPIFHSEIGDVTAPVVSSGAITASNISKSEVTLSWNEATDTITANQDLLYCLYMSASDNLDTVSDIEAIGIPISEYLNMNIYNVSNLNSGSIYYFNIIVKDEAGNKASYDAMSVTTAASGGGGGSSYTPPTIVVITEENNNSTTNSTEIPSSTVSGTTSATVGTLIVDALLDKISSDGGSEKNDLIELAIDIKTGIDELKITILQKDLAEIIDKTDASLGIASPFISILFDAQALEAISAAESGGTVVISAGIIDNDSLSEADKAKVQGRPVYDLTVVNGDTQVSDFNGGQATVTIPYTLQPGENPNALVIYYLADDGTLKAVRGHYDASLKAVVFKTTHFSNFVIGYNPVSFNDVAADSWYKNAVDFIAAREITSGTGNNMFSPEAKLTRAQFVVLLMSAYQINSQNQGAANQTQNFSDAGNTYYTDYLLTAKALGIVNGVGNNMFAPEKEITRQEMFVMLYNALKVIDEVPANVNSIQLSRFNDADKIAVWANEALSSLVKTGTVGGYNNNLYPTATTTRAEIAQVLYNLLSN